MKKVAVYYRVSTEKQDLASQRDVVEKWLNDLDDKKKPDHITVFKDEGISGKTASRPGYQEMLKTAFSKKIDTIVVYRLDRMSRNATEAIQTLLSLDAAGVAFISVTQPVLNLGHENPFRRTMLAAFAEIAEIERETIVMRVKSGLEAAKKRGVRLGPPIKANEETQLEIKRLRSEGKSYSDIAKITGLGKGTVHRLDKAESLKET